MKRAVLTLSSHKIGYYKKCPYMYYLGEMRKIEPIKPYVPFIRGSIITSLIAEHYWHKIVGEKFDTWEAFERIVQKCPHLDDEIKQTIESKFLAYLKYYKNESWIPIAVERSRFAPNTENKGTGFSKIIYESPYVLFVWEGEPDLIVQLSARDKRLIVVDTKHETRKHQLYLFVDQFIGYCCAAATNSFAINYFSLIKSGKPEDWFRRSSVVFHSNQIKAWKQNTIRWFHKIAAARKNKKFPKSGLCESRYGVCPYSDLCEQTQDWIVDELIKKKFKQKERTESW